MKRSKLVTRALAGGALLLAVAARGDAASNLDQLLEETKNLRAREAKENAAREQEFRASSAEQATLLQQADAKRKAAEARSQRLSAQYDENEKQIAELEKALEERSGNLGELFGVTRQVAGDTATALSQSMISGELPDREAFMRKLADSKELPSIGELEQLWFELQREMTESGRVRRFRTKVIAPGGQATEREVVRVGPFIAVSDGNYLNYLPLQKSLTVLPRQITGELADVARNLQGARDGYVRAAADPSRGVLLALYVERPTLFERIERGELIGYVILAVGILGALAALYQFFYLLRTRLAIRRQLANLSQPRSDNPLGRVLLSFKGDPKRIEDDAEVAELRISEAVLREIPRVERFQSFLRLAVAAGPLLGLVGTVIGMIITFQSITESGSSDPRLMANGIGQAMIATVLGLGIAIPLLFANAGLATMSRQIVSILDEQSTGLLAEGIEAKQRSVVGSASSVAA
jgi:biopolymer transport protein ExbB